MKRNLFLLVLILFINSSLSSQTKVKFYTTKGDFVVELNETLAPITAGNFKTLVEEKYYDGVIFHRVIDNFMIQGGQGATKPTIQDEFHDSLSNVQGTISMANAGPNTGTTQFFINLIDNTRLDYNKAPLTSKHPVFGKVIENFSVVQTIGKVPTNGNPPTGANKPLTDVVMDSLRIVPKEAPSSIQLVGNVNKMHLSCFPNPIGNSSFVVLGASTNPVDLYLFDILGNQVARTQIAPSKNISKINFKDWVGQSMSPGVYMIQSNDGQQASTFRVVVE